MNKHKMRNLKTGDIYKMSAILKKMNIKFEVEKGISQEQMGLQMIQKVVESLHLAQTEVNAFLAELVDITPEEFNELPISETIDIINQFKNQKDIGAFLKLAGK